MDNFQLYSTDVLLGGLTCWDIIIDEKDSHTIISDFHISPINKRIPFNIDSDEYLLNSTHEENVLKFYKNIKKYFYEGYIDPKINSIFPQISNDINEKILHNNIYEMGCEFIEKYRYNKSFEILCPIWIELLGPEDKLSFDLIIKNKNTNKSIDRVLGKINIPFYSIDFAEYHNNFIKYFRNYIKTSGLDKGSDRIININLENNEFSIKGLNVATGNTDTKINNIFLNNLLYRERPLLESDNMIINNFKDNHMVVNQLFNFRFYFNIEDIIYQLTLLKDLNFKDFIISIKAKINDHELPMRDFYTNYEFIWKKYCTFDHNDKLDDTKLNILDYLKDNQCIDLFSKNKLYSPTIHWSLNDNNDYIFNLYKGFAGYSKNNDKIINHDELYSDSPNLNQFKYYEELNNIGWCNCIDFNNDDMLILLPKRIELGKVHHISFNEFDKYKQLIFNNFSINLILNQWNKNIKYKNYNTGIREIINPVCLYITPGISSSLSDNENIFKEVIFNKYIDMEEFYQDLHNIDPKIWDKNCNIYIIHDKINQNNVIYFISNNKDALTFASIKYILNYIKRRNYSNLSDNFKSNINKLEERLNMAIDPKYIAFTRSLNAVKADSPSQFSSEIIYYKNNNILKKIYRYDGNIKPTFLSEKESMEKNIFYYRDIIKITDVLKLKKYNKYIKYSYLPIYPSIGFSGIKSNKLIYNPNTLCEDCDYISKILKDKIEYKWYNNSKILYLPNELNIDLSLDNILETKLFEDKIFEEVFKIYRITNEKIKPIIKKRYTYTILSDNQKIEDNKIIYNYLIKLILK